MWLLYMGFTAGVLTHHQKPSWEIIISESPKTYSQESPSPSPNFPPAVAAAAQQPGSDRQQLPRLRGTPAATGSRAASRGARWSAASGAQVLPMKAEPNLGIIGIYGNPPQTNRHTTGISGQFCLSVDKFSVAAEWFSTGVGLKAWGFLGGPPGSWHQVEIYRSSEACWTILCVSGDTVVAIYDIANSWWCVEKHREFTIAKIHMDTKKTRLSTVRFTTHGGHILFEILWYISWLKSVVLWEVNLIVNPQTPPKPSKLKKKTLKQIYIYVCIFIDLCIYLFIYIYIHLII